MNLFKTCLFAFAVFALTVPAAFAGEGSFSSEQKQEIKDVVRQYLRDNPEVLVEAIQALQSKRTSMERKQKKEILSTMRHELENDPTSPVGGNPEGDVTIVEFFDYRCGFCKRALPLILELMESDGDIRYVLREYPILGEASKVASRAALSVWGMNKEKYMPFHITLMEAKGGLDETKIFKIAAKAGIDIDKLREAMKDPSIDKIINKNYELADKLGITGTPAFVIGETFAGGLMSLEAMKKAVAKARK